jgi:hypothetical protein
VVPFLLVCAELALVLLAVDRFDIEKQRHFFPMLCLAAGGFAVHAWLPARLRPGFFALLSLAGILLILGWATGAGVIGVGAGLIGLASLPIPAVYRAGLVAFAGLQLAAVRVQYDWPFWPVLASMFMFRLIVYLFDTRHARGRRPSWHTLSYFFCLPNVGFTLFPVIDYTTYRETYQTEDPYPVYQTGVEWIVRGLGHLLLYRVVKYYLLPAPSDLRDLPHVALFLATNYALYLRVSGHFHIITGILHLFGYGLPRTHHNYFLASSFTDIWRRINIYWKDFMAEVFFFPALFTVRRRLGERAAFAVAALGVFGATWLLHAYQVFWITGNLPLTLNDALLWLAAGVLVAVNLQFDLSRPGRPADPARRPSLAGAALLSLRVAGMFALVSLFWACWTIPGFLEHLRVLDAGSGFAARDLLGLAAVVLGVVAVGVLAQLVRSRLYRAGALPLSWSLPRSAAVQAALLSLLIAAGLPQVAAVLGPSAAGAIARLRGESQTPVEVSQVVRGYYEEITDAPVQAGPFLASLEGRPQPPEQHPFYIDMTRPAGDLLERELIPGWTGELAGARITVNSQGMRDREAIPQHKPADVCRIAVVGSSIVMGYGVGDDQTFCRLLEGRLNADRPAGGRRFELLNFGAGMCYAINRRAIIDKKVFAFEPDAVLYVAHQDEFLGPPPHLARLVAHGTPLPDACLHDVLQQAKITPQMAWGEVQSRLQTFGPEIVRCVYGGIVADCRRRSVLPVWVYVPVPGVTEAPSQSSAFVKLATEAGFVVIDLSHWADGHAPLDVKLGTSEHHANALGHRLIAEKLEAALRQRPEALPACARARE